jgi:hypothetical protein
MAVSAKPEILWKNILTLSAATVTAISEEANAPVENCFDYRTFSFHRADEGGGTSYIRVDAGSVVTANRLAVILHDLFTQGATITVWRTNAAYTHLENLGSLTPTSNDTFIIELSGTTSSQYWEIEITGATDDPFLGHINLGEVMVMDRRPLDGFDLHSQQGLSEAFVSSKGHFLEAVTRFIERGIVMDFSSLSETFVADELLPFINQNYMLQIPLFLVPDKTNYPSYVFFLRAPKDPSFTAPTSVEDRDFVLELVGVKQGDTT